MFVILLFVQFLRTVCLRRDFKEGLEIEFTHFEGIGDISPNFELFECGRKFSTKNRLFYDKFLINGCQ